MCILEEVFNNFKSICEAQISALPSSARLRKETFDFKKFDSEVYIPFVAAFKGEIKDAFSGIDFWTCFTIFDPRKLPEESPSLLPYGIDDLQTLIIMVNLKKTHF